MIQTQKNNEFNLESIRQIMHQDSYAVLAHDFISTYGGNIGETFR
jgi:hypothetical protein